MRRIYRTELKKNGALLLRKKKSSGPSLFCFFLLLPKESCECVRCLFISSKKELWGFLLYCACVCVRAPIFYLHVASIIACGFTQIFSFCNPVNTLVRLFTQSARHTRLLR